MILPWSSFQSKVKLALGQAAGKDIAKTNDTLIVGIELLQTMVVSMLRPHVYDIGNLKYKTSDNGIIASMRLVHQQCLVLLRSIPVHEKYCLDKHPLPAFFL